MGNLTKYCALVFGVIALIASAQAQAPALRPLGIGLGEIDYPYPVHYIDLTIEGQFLRMAYMDVAPAGAANGKTVALLHGKSFAGDYWGRTAAKLSAEGYHVVVPDQLGFGKSAKPDIRLQLRSSRPQYENPARQPRRDARRDCRSFVRRHARGLFCARLSRDDGGSDAGKPHRPGRLPKRHPAPANRDAVQDRNGADA